MPAALAFFHAAFVHDPCSLCISQVSILQHSGNRDGIIVVDDALPFEFVISPFSLICDAAIGVGEHSKAMHFVVLPLSIIAAPLRVKEFACAIPFAISLKPFVFGANLILFDDIFVLSKVGVLLLHFVNSWGQFVSIERACFAKLEPLWGSDWRRLALLFLLFCGVGFFMMGGVDIVNHHVLSLSRKLL